MPNAQAQRRRRRTQPRRQEQNRRSLQRPVRLWSVRAPKEPPCPPPHRTRVPAVRHGRAARPQAPASRPPSGRTRAPAARHQRRARWQAPVSDPADRHQATSYCRPVNEAGAEGPKDRRATKGAGTSLRQAGDLPESLTAKLSDRHRRSQGWNSEKARPPVPVRWSAWLGP